MWNVFFFFFLKFSTLLICLIKDRLIKMNFCALHFVCFCYNSFILYILEQNFSELIQCMRLNKRWEMNSQITSKFWLQPKQRRRDVNTEGIRTLRVRTHRSGVCSVLLSLLFSKHTHAIFIITIALSDRARPLALLLTLVDCVPCKYSAFPEGKLREQAVHKGVKYQSCSLKVKIKSVKLLFPVQPH